MPSSTARAAGVAAARGRRYLSVKVLFLGKDPDDSHALGARHPAGRLSAWSVLRRRPRAERCSSDGFGDNIVERDGADDYLIDTHHDPSHSDNQDVDWRAEQGTAHRRDGQPQGFGG